jgi:hypothetical protein
VPAVTIGFAGDAPTATVSKMEDAIESFIRFLAVERGLSEIISSPPKGR